MRAAVLAAATLSIGADAQSPQARPEPTRPGQSWALADALERRFKAIEASFRQNKRLPEPNIMVRENELNSYLNLTLAPQLPPGVGDLEVHFTRDRLEAKGLVDLDKLPLKQAAGSSAFSPLNFLSGRVPVELKGRLTTEDGFATFEPEDIRLATIPIPASAVAKAVAQSTRSNQYPDGFDILSPFRLPYGAKRVRLQPAKILLEF
jgi:hypothetical protein